MTNRFSKAALGTACSALILGSSILLASLAPAQAAPQDRPRPTADLKAAGSKLAQVDPVTTSSIAKAPSEELPVCDRARRRLWIEGEGWVVRRVSTCH